MMPWDALIHAGFSMTEARWTPLGGAAGGARHGPLALKAHCRVLETPLRTPAAAGKKRDVFGTLLAATDVQKCWGRGKVPRSE